MKRLLALLLLAGLAAPVFAEMDAKDAAGIAKLTDAFATAWNAHDAKAMAALYNKDADIINPMGRIAKGQSEIEKLFSDDQSGAMKNSKLTMKPGDIRKLSWNHFFLDTEGDIAGITDPAGQTAGMKFHASALVEKNEGKFSFINVRAYSFAPAAPSAAATAAVAPAPAAAPAAPAPAPQVPEKK